MSNYNTIVPHYSVMLADSLATIIQNQYSFKYRISMELISAAMNDVYRVRSGEYRYYLRIPRKERFWPFSAESYHFETGLLSYLHSKEFNVSYPIPTTANSYIGILNAPEGIRYFSLFTEAIGQTPSPGSSNHLELMGQYLARFHSLTEDFKPRDQGIEWSLELLVNNGLDKLSLEIPQDLKSNLDKIRHKAKELISRFHEIMPHRNDHIWGIIHGDFSPDNLRIIDDQITAFDFEYTGIGYRIFDLAPMLMRTSIHNLKDKSFAAFLKGYCSVRELADYEIEALPLITKLALISRTTVSAGMKNLVGLLWFENKIRHDLKLLDKVL